MKGWFSDFVVVRYGLTMVMLQGLLVGAMAMVLRLADSEKDFVLQYIDRKIGAASSSGLTCSLYCALS